MSSLNYKLTDETQEVGGVTLHRIEATRDIPSRGVNAGQAGGWVEKESNLRGKAWVYGNARIYGDAQVYGNAVVYGNAQVYGNARVCANAQVYGNARVYGDAIVIDTALVCDHAAIYGSAMVYDRSEVSGYARISENAKVGGSVRVYDDAEVFGSTLIYGSAVISNNARIGHTMDCLHAFSYTSRPLKLTLTRQEGGHLIIMGCWSGSIEEFEQLIARPYWVETLGDDVVEARPEMEVWALLMRTRINRWK